MSSSVLSELLDAVRSAKPFVDEPSIRCVGLWLWVLCAYGGSSTHKDTSDLFFRVLLSTRFVLLASVLEAIHVDRNWLCRFEPAKNINAACHSSGNPIRVSEQPVYSIKI